VFRVGLPDLAEQEAFQSRHPLAIFHAHLTQQLMDSPDFSG
jgi:hypothetical protein